MIAPFPDDFIKLPDPGNYICRSDFAPCPCGEVVFDILFSERITKLEDGTNVMRQTVDVCCPVCPLISNKDVRQNWKIGSLDNATGKMTLMDSSPVDFPLPSSETSAKATTRKPIRRPAVTEPLFFEEVAG